VVESKSKNRGNGFYGNIKIIKPRDEWDCWKNRSILIGEIRRKRCGFIISY